MNYYWKCSFCDEQFNTRSELETHKNETKHRTNHIKWISNKTAADYICADEAVNGPGFIPQPEVEDEIIEEEE